MEPIIYGILRNNDPIFLRTDDIYFDTNPSPKLIKFGFNNITEELDLMTITSVPYYKVGLNFDFDRTDKNSIIYLAKDRLGTDNSNLSFGEFWEIILLFNLFNREQTIITSHPDVVTDIIASYGIVGTKSRIELLKRPKKNQTATLILHKYSDIDIDENAAVAFIINDLAYLFSIQDIGSSLILQLYSTQTQIMAELIYYISSYYEEAYILKPSITPEISDSKYLILLRLRQIPEFSLPKYSKNSYLASIGIKNLPVDFITTIQCANSETMVRKYKKYYEIKAYIDSKIYEGAVYQEMLRSQNDNAIKWLNTYTNIASMPKLLESALTKSDKKCLKFTKTLF